MSSSNNDTATGWLLMRVSTMRKHVLVMMVMAGLLLISIAGGVAAAAAAIRQHGGVVMRVHWDAQSPSLLNIRGNVR